MIVACAVCSTPIEWVYCPTGGWWSHLIHPADEHDGAPSPAIEAVTRSIIEAVEEADE